MANPRLQIVLTTCPDKDTATRIASSLVNEGIAACVNILAAAQSVYLWKGTVETENEHVLLIKATADHYEAIQARIQALHPYELPEIIAVPIVAGLKEYLAWVENPREND
ncbi:MAG: divalent-cation tolerance protein CutA [Acidiferrobacterales bacterium]